VLQEVLRSEGHRILTASSVQEAEALHKRLGLAGVDLVITNLRLTRRPQARQGAELIQRWQAVVPRLPYILMSSDLRPHERTDLPSKVVWYVAKPFSTEVFLATIQEAFARRQEVKPLQYRAGDEGFNGARAGPEGACRREDTAAVGLCAAKSYERPAHLYVISVAIWHSIDVFFDSFWITWLC
jgi:DNA-binding NtrC family response regulator